MYFTHQIFVSSTFKFQIVIFLCGSLTERNANDLYGFLMMPPRAPRFSFEKNQKNSKISIIFHPKAGFPIAPHIRISDPNIRDPIPKSESSCVVLCLLWLFGFFGEIVSIWPNIQFNYEFILCNFLISE